MKIGWIIGIFAAFAVVLYLFTQNGGSSYSTTPLASNASASNAAYIAAGASALSSISDVLGQSGGDDSDDDD